MERQGTESHSGSAEIGYGGEHRPDSVPVLLQESELRVSRSYPSWSDLGRQLGNAHLFTAAVSSVAQLEPPSDRTGAWLYAVHHVSQDPERLHVNARLFSEALRRCGPESRPILVAMTPGVPGNPEAVTSTGNARYDSYPIITLWYNYYHHPPTWQWGDGEQVRRLGAAIGLPRMEGSTASVVVRAENRRIEDAAQPRALTAEHRIADLERELDDLRRQTQWYHDQWEQYERRFSLVAQFFSSP